MIYDYLLMVFRLTIGLLTKQNLILFASLGLLAYLIWIVVATLLSYLRKFNKKCDDLKKFVQENEGTEENLEKTSEMAKAISAGLGKGIDGFKKNKVGFPSTYISKVEAVESEVNGGVLNHGKSFMKMFINITTIALFVLNIAFLGKDDPLTGTILAQSMILPLLYFFICKLFYFLYTRISQQYYKLCVESFTGLVNALDEKYGSAEVLVAKSSVRAAEEEAQVEEAKEETAEETKEAQAEETPEETEQPAEVEETSPKKEKTIDDYDYFKKKNIDVEKFKDEIPSNSSSLPYIDVDSDYVIKDDEKVNSYHPNAKNGSELLGGMLHNMTISKKEEPAQPKEPVEEKPAPKKVEEQPQAAKKPKTETETDNLEDVFSNLEQFKIDDGDDATEESPISSLEEDAEKSEKNSESAEATETPVSPDTESEKVETSENVENTAETEKVEEVKPSEETLSPKTQAEETSVELKPTEEDESEKITNLVGKFKTRSRLATGGIEIERTVNGTSNNIGENSNRGYKERKIQVLNSENDDGKVISAVKNSTTLSQEDYYNQQNNNSFEQTYYDGSQNLQAQNVYGEMQQYPNSDYNNVDYNNVNYNNVYNQPVYDGYANPYMPQQEYYGEYSQPEQTQMQPEQVSEVPERKTRTKTKTEQPAPKKTASAKKESVMEEEMKSKRGRPAKQVFDETVSIKNDAEFEQVLSRAEKLMKKSEQALSPSQSKRVEKELKTLLDAMNRYKESKQ